MPSDWLFLSLRRQSRGALVLIIVMNGLLAWLDHFFKSEHRVSSSSMVESLRCGRLGNTVDSPYTLVVVTRLRWYAPL